MSEEELFNTGSSNRLRRKRVSSSLVQPPLRLAKLPASRLDPVSLLSGERMMDKMVRTLSREERRAIFLRAWRFVVGW
jgi:hypothetical protein